MVIKKSACLVMWMMGLCLANSAWGILAIGDGDIVGNHYTYRLTYEDMANSTKFDNDVFVQNKVHVLQEGTVRYVGIMNETFNDDSLIYKFDFASTSYRPTELVLNSIMLMANDQKNTTDRISYSTDGTNWIDLATHDHRAGTYEGYSTGTIVIPLDQPDVVYYRWYVYVNDEYWPDCRMDQGWRQWARCETGGGFQADFTMVSTLVTVEGKVQMQGYLGNKDAWGARVSFTSVIGGDNITRTTLLGADGAFHVDSIPPGTYNIAIQVGCLLAERLDHVTLTAPSTDLGTIELKGGDSNGDNAVTFEDFSILQNNYGERGGSAAVVAPRTTVPHAVDGFLSAGEWASLQSDPVPDKPVSGCVELVRWGAEVRDGILYAAFELDPASYDVAYYDNFAAGNRLWLGLWIDADPAADPVTGVADGDDQFAPPRAQDINIELGMDNGSLVCRTADWNSLNFWGRGNTFNAYVPVTVNAAYQGHVVEFAVPVADIMAEIALTDGATPGNVWKIGARAAGHVSGEDYAGDITDLQSVTVFGIEGAIILQGYQGDNATLGIQCVFTPAGGGTTVTRTAILNADGTFRLDPAPVGTYNITIKSGTSLSAILNSINVGSSVTDMGTIELKNADVNGDDQISFGDFSILQNNYGESGAAASPLAALIGGCGGLGILVFAFLGLAFFALRPRNE